MRKRAKGAASAKPGCYAPDPPAVRRGPPPSNRRIDALAPSEQHCPADATAAHLQRRPFDLLETLVDGSVLPRFGLAARTLQQAAGTPCCADFRGERYRMRRAWKVRWLSSPRASLFSSACPSALADDTTVVWEWNCGAMTRNGELIWNSGAMIILIRVFMIKWDFGRPPSRRNGRRQEA